MKSAARGQNVRPAPSIPKYRIMTVSMLLIFCLLGVFAVRLRVEQLSGMSLTVFSHTNGLYADWFLSCKETLYTILAMAMCCYAGAERLFPDTLCRCNPLYRRSALLPVCCIGGYVLLTVLSALFSEHREVVWRGCCTEYEGLAAIGSYCVLFLFGFNFISGKRLLRTLTIALAVLGAVCAALAVMEYTAVPLMELPFMKYLTAPPKYRDTAATLERANDFREAVLLFHNANYAGAFFAMLFPFPVMGMLCAKRKLVQIGSGVLCAALACAVIMTNATAAFYLMAAELVVILAVLLLKRSFRPVPFLAGAGAFAVLALGISACTGSDFLRTLQKSAVNAGTYAAQETQYRLREVRISGRTLYLAGDNSGYTVMPPYDAGEMLGILPDAGTECTVGEQTAVSASIRDSASGAMLSAYVLEGILHVDAGYDSTIDFAVTTDGLQLIGQNGALLPEVPTAPMAESPLTKYYSAFTGRGYIWLNSVPMLKTCILLGKGAGNFPFYFVQNDVVGLCNTDGNYRFVIDKAHSMYLQIAAASGIPALICVLLLFGSFAVLGSGCLLRAKPDAFREDKRLPLLLCLYAGCIGCMIGGIVNDSSVAVSPVFWLLLGTGYSLCIRIRKGDAEV